jgi:Mg2+/Co2+ transporter CorC
MSHTPEKWYVGYDQEYDIDAGDDGRTIGYPTGRDEFDGTVFMVTDEDQVEIIAEHIRDEKTAHQIKAIPDMLEALETIMDIGDKACRDIARAAITKARREE